MSRAYRSEADKVRDFTEVMEKYIVGKIADVGCGSDKITPSAFGIDGRHLEGVDIVTENVYELSSELEHDFDTVFSSHFLEHLADQYGALNDWQKILKPGGHLVLYLPTSPQYNNRQNPEHMVDMNYGDFLWWFKQAWCGQGKNFKGENITPVFELVFHGLDVDRPDCYSFLIIARKL